MTNSEHIPNGQVSELPSYTRMDAAGPKSFNEHPAGHVVYWADYKRLMDHLLPYKEELLKIADQVGEPGDPFAAWEAIDALTRRSSAGVRGETKTEAQPIHALPMPPYDFQGNAALTPSPTLEPSFRQGDIDMAKHFARQEYFSPNADQAGKLDRALSKLVEYLRPSPTLEPTDAEVERAARAIYAEVPNFGMDWRPNTHGGYDQVRVDDVWEDAPDRHEDCRRQARAALIASRQSTSGNQDGGKP